MTYILVILMMVGTGTTSQQMEFSSKEACDMAGRAAVSQLSSGGRFSTEVRYVCIERH